MFEWFKRRRHKRAISDAYRLLNDIYTNLNPDMREKVSKAFYEMLDEYKAIWGTDDGVVAFYCDRFHYLITVVNRRESYL